MRKQKHPLILCLNIIIFFFTVLFYYSGNLALSFKGITPLLILPLLTAYSIFHSPLRSAVVGLLCGIFMDANATDSYCFNAVLLLLIGCFVSVAANNLFNKNIQSAAVLSLLSGGFYFVLQWLFFHTNNVTAEDSLIYLLKYAFPTAIISAVFIIPFYYLYKHFDKITSQ